MEKPTKLVIDVQQWKRDIQTFVKTTHQVLNAIAAELSNECSNGHAPRPRNIDATASGRIGSFTSTTTSHSPNDDRLANLKSQLADRISKSH